MMKRFLLLLLLALGTLFARAQTAFVQSVKLNQDLGTITIQYTLNNVNADDYVAVKITAISHGQRIPLKSASGDIGRGVQPRGTKTVVWDAFQDNLQDTSGLTFHFDILTLPGKYAKNGEKLASTGRAKVPFITMGIGAGIGLYGLVPYLQSKNLYDTYSTNLDPRSEVFGETSRDEHLSQANQKLRTTQIAAASGGAILLGGVIAYLKYKKRRNTWETMKSWSLEPAPVQAAGLANAGLQGMPLGLKMTFNLSK